MLKQNKIHQDQLEKLKQEGKVVEDKDTIILKEKLNRYQTTLAQKEKEKNQLKLEIKDKSVVIKALEEKLSEAKKEDIKVKNETKKERAKSTKAIKNLEYQVKQLEGQRDQSEQKVEVSAKVINEEVDPGLKNQFKRMSESGEKKRADELLQENQMLKALM